MKNNLEAGILEINPRANENFRMFKQLSRESILIILVAICVIITVGTHIRMNTLVDDMADLKAGSEVNIRVVLESNADLKKEVRILQNKIDRYQANLHSGDD